MAKIQGNVGRHNVDHLEAFRPPATIEFYTKDHIYQESDVSATLVVGEKAFTESELRTMVNEMITKKVFRSTQRRSDHAVMVSDIRSVLKKYGVTLDPA